MCCVHVYFLLCTSFQTVTFDSYINARFTGLSELAARYAHAHTHTITQYRSVALIVCANCSGICLHDVVNRTVIYYTHSGFLCKHCVCFQHFDALFNIYHKTVSHIIVLHNNCST
jgi:hypothetical protein